MFIQYPRESDEYPNETRKRRIREASKTGGYSAMNKKDTRTEAEIMNDFYKNGFQ